MATTANALVRLAKPLKNEVILDPFCGVGTILIEADSVFKDDLKYIGLDINRDSLSSAKENAFLAGAKTIKFIIGDATELSKYIHSKVDIIVTDPPYFVNSEENSKKILEQFLFEAPRILSDSGKLVILTEFPNIVKKFVTENKYFIKDFRKVGRSGRYVYLFFILKG